MCIEALSKEVTILEKPMVGYKMVERGKRGVLKSPYYYRSLQPSYTVDHRAVNLEYREGRVTVAAENTPGIYFHKKRECAENANPGSGKRAKRKFVVIRVIIPARTSVRFARADSTDVEQFTAYVVLVDCVLKNKEAS